jgi:hypothetical protein
MDLRRDQLDTADTPAADTPAAVAHLRRGARPVMAAVSDYVVGSAGSLAVSFLGIVASYVLSVREASKRAAQQTNRHTAVVRALTLVEIQRAFDIAYRNDLDRWHTIHDLLTWLKASDNFPVAVWGEGIQRALDHLDSHQVIRPLIVDPDLETRVKTGIGEP